MFHTRRKKRLSQKALDARGKNDVIFAQPAGYQHLAFAAGARKGNIQLAVGEGAAVNVYHDAGPRFSLCLVDGQGLTQPPRKLDERAGFLFADIAGLLINVGGVRFPICPTAGRIFVLLQ